MVTVLQVGTLEGFVRAGRVRSTVLRFAFEGGWCD
jgi:hypothetical protein